MEDHCVVTSPFSNVTSGGVSPVLERYETALLLLLGFGGISIGLAILHRTIRKHVFHDEHNVDTSFDAGGRVSTSLTAVTVASQLLWPGDLLQPATTTVKSGISGPFWYSVGCAVNIVLFPILSIYLKTRAPGAKTYLQIIFARFGKRAHIVFCFLALLVNVLVMSTLLVAGVTIIQSLTNDASDEFCVLIIATLCGSYSFVGGLGTTFYVSYFNTVLVFITLVCLLVKILYSPDNPEQSVGSLEDIYKRLQCLHGPDGNEENSFLTFRSENGWTFAVIGVCLTSSLTYCDQASWQSRIAAKPLQGVLGFLFATYMWFAIPSSIAATTGLAYLAMTADNTTLPISLDQVNQGLITPFMAEQLLGRTGGILVLTMFAMALMSTGSGEIMAVSSIVVYDIYQTYINPFRQVGGVDECVLCGKRKAEALPEMNLSELAESSLKPENGTAMTEKCECPPFESCEACNSCTPTSNPRDKQRAVMNCRYHGDFVAYQEELFRYKSWCILWVTLALVPWGLVVIASGVDLNWIMIFGFIITIPCFPAVALSIFSSKTTGPGVISGATVGMVGGMSAALGVASTYEGGLGRFLENTAQNSCVLAGACTSLVLSFAVTLAVSLFTTTVKREADVSREWRKLRHIDNPLHPWCNLYRKEFPDLKPGEQPSVEELDAVFSRARIVAYVGGFGSLLLLAAVVPASMISLHVVSLNQFKAWIYVLQALCFSMAAVVIVLAPLEEVVQIYRQFKRNKQTKATVS